MVAGRNDSEGRIEVLYNDIWGTICDDMWDSLDAAVACKEAGWPNVVQIRDTFGPGNGTIWLDELNCRGNEESLANCSHIGWNMSDCDHSEDAGLICAGRPTISII